MTPNKINSKNLDDIKKIDIENNNLKQLKNIDSIHLLKDLKEKSKKNSMYNTKSLKSLISSKSYAFESM